MLEEKETLNVSMLKQKKKNSSIIYFNWFLNIFILNSLETCPCTKEDYECLDGLYKANENSDCKPISKEGEELLKRI